MKIAIIALGSRGDVQPYIALSKGLHQAGHTVRLITHESYEAQTKAHGVPFWPVAGDVQEVIQSPEMRELLGKGNMLAINRATAKHVQRVVLDWQRDSLAACRGMDLLVAGVGGLYLGLAMAQKLGLPLLEAHVFPFTPTAVFPAPLFPTWVAKLGRAATRLTYHLMRQIMWQGVRRADNLARQQVLDLPRAPFWGPYRSEAIKNSTVLYGISPAVLPKPIDWDEKTHVTGYWYLDAATDWHPPADLVRFLQAGPPPVYIGFGSMTARNVAETADLLAEAILRSNQRAIVALDWDDIPNYPLPDTIYPLKSAPHDWLFKQVTAVVHHGGAGTTAAGLRAGVPSFIVPFFGDQMFWGKRVFALGVGPHPVARKKLTSEALSEALRVMQSDTGMRQRAADLGAKIEAEDGVARAVALIEQMQLAA